MQCCKVLPYFSHVSQFEIPQSPFLLLSLVKFQGCCTGVFLWCVIRVLCDLWRTNELLTSIQNCSTQFYVTLRSESPSRFSPTVFSQNQWSENQLINQSQLIKLSENQLINQSQLIKLVNWYWLVLVNRWSIHNQTKTIHRLPSIGTGPWTLISDHLPFLGSPGDEIGKTIPEASKCSRRKEYTHFICTWITQLPVFAFPYYHVYTRILGRGHCQRISSLSFLGWTLVKCLWLCSLLSG